MEATVFFISWSQKWHHVSSAIVCLLGLSQWSWEKGLCKGVNARRQRSLAGSCLPYLPHHVLGLQQMPHHAETKQCVLACVNVRPSHILRALLITPGPAEVLNIHEVATED